MLIGRSQFAIDSKLDPTRAGGSTRASLTRAKPPRPSPRPLTPSDLLTLSAPAALVCVIVADDLTMMMSPSAYRKTLKLRSIDDKIIIVDDEKIIRESDLMKFAIFQIGKSAEVIEVPLNSIDADAVYLLIRLAECFRNDPPYYETNGVKDFDCMPSDHPAIMFTQQLSTNDFIAVSKAARCMRAQRLMDFLGSTSHKACTPQLINNVLKEGPFFTDVDHVRACG